MINEVRLVGRLGTDPEVKVLQNGTKLTKISLVTTKVWKNKEGTKQEKNSWHNISMFANTAENAEKILKKGSLVWIKGEIDYNTVEQPDGKSIKYTNIAAEDFRILSDGKNSNPENGQQQQQQAPQQQAPQQQAPQQQPQPQGAGNSVIDDDDDDLPF